MRIRWQRIKKVIWAAVVVSAVACSSDPSGPLQVKVIRPVTGRRCAYVIEPAPLVTLSSLSSVSGAIGAVVFASENLGTRPEILEQQQGLYSLATQFASSGLTYSALDLDSLYAASLYYAVETAHLTMSRLDPAGDMTQMVPDFANRTRIVHEARRTFGELGQDPEVTDNAEYLAKRIGEGESSYVLNYLFSYPTVDVKEVPLGLNLGIMAHEYSHLVMRHRFYEPGIKRDVGVASGKPTMNTLAALDEGLADYFGFLASGDPSFFLCSFPNEPRDLLAPKSFTDESITRIASGTSFDSHEGGAIFAAINYEIGQAIGFDENGKYLLRLMNYLLECPSTQSGTSSLSFNFKDVASCHASLAESRHQATIRQLYNARLGSYGGI
jgi:hypothetical protein